MTAQRVSSLNRPSTSGIELAMLLCAPSLIKTALHQSSLASGLILTAVGLTIASFATDRWHKPTRIGLVGLAVAAWSLVALAVAVVLGVLDGHLSAGGRALGSLAVLSLLAVLALRLASSLSAMDVKQLERQVDMALLILAVNGALAMTGLQFFANQSSEKPTGLFSEPSHLGLALAFPLLAKALGGGRSSLAWVAGWLAWALAIQNLTSVCVTVVCLLCWARKLVPTLALLGLLGLALLLADTEYFVSRLAIGDEVSNLSALVWLYGWQTAIRTIQDVSPWGLGFQQLGIRDVFTEAVSLIEILEPSGLNANDGGTTGAKLIAEFGVIGLFALAFWAVAAVWGVLRLFLAGHDLRRHDICFAYRRAALLCPIIEILVRGVGYFSPTLLLCAIVALTLIFEGALDEN